MKTLIIIPARGGSKGIPGKNIIPFAGKPLILHTLELARQFAAEKDICITTDSPEIAALVASAGYKVPFIRPEMLATDQSGMYEVLLHALKHYQESGSYYERILLLQPTSPFRLPHHIESAFALFTPSDDMVVSVKESKANPYFVLFEENSEGYLEKSKQGSFIRRQDCPPVWEYNGAIYVINIQSLLQSPIHGFKKVTKFVMDELHSVDLDTPLDWDYAEFLNEKYHLLPL
ncbi:CMP-N,N'-diacetyllegionaminic acid synthase [bioreactor metagenome]|jgi:N-acylneuraminate cytidylyltransferase|uniref:CMP-N,N'-diacetyllegionaminic acid synthase n=1 Tax=bioreactor metagenome TaxID=1076179 RepID=A0A644UU03_9ZZZZ|nr:acylneuraminate cytidylyltransferase family protein [Lentimicrobium sp.]MEA5109849.1 acylneuraminate cytidylyltransferase family protein [Lentimicrobium sp.]